MRHFDEDRGVLERIIILLLFLALVITPIAYMGEVSAFISGGIDSALTVSSNKFFVAFKNIIAPLMVFMAGIVWLRQKNTLRDLKGRYLLIVLIVMFLSITLSKYSGVLLFLSGVRWITPLILTILLIGIICERDLRNISIGVCGIFFIHFILQIYETIYGSHWYGVILGTNLAARAPGIFENPNTASMFSCLSFILAYKFIGYKNPFAKLVMILSPVSVFITLSGGGLFTICVLFFSVIFKSKWRKLFPLILISSAAVVQLIMPLFRGGWGYIESSFITRGILLTEAAVGGRGVDIVQKNVISDGLLTYHQNKYFFNYLNIGIPEWLSSALNKLFGVREKSFDLISILFGQSFGSGTNGCALIQHNFSLKLPCVMGESLYAQMFINIGWVGSIVVFTPLVMAAFFAFKNNNKAMFLVLFLASISALNNTMFEAFPMSILVPALLSFWFFEMKYSNYSPHKPY